MWYSNFFVRLFSGSAAKNRPPHERRQTRIDARHPPLTRPGKGPPMNAKEKVALGSIVASAGLAGGEGRHWPPHRLACDPVEAGHSLIDLSATLLTYFAVRVSGKPADAEHQYGHGKVESVTALAETALLFAAHSRGDLRGDAAADRRASACGRATAAAFVIIVGSIAVDFFRARTLRRVAKATSSEALEADALHFGSDMWSSVAVLIGLCGVALGYPCADAAAAIVVAVFICIAGWRLGRRTINTLTDTAPAGVSERVAAIARLEPGVVAVERVRARPAGAVLFVDLGIGVSRTLPLDRVAAITERLTRDIRAELPNAEVTITTRPRARQRNRARSRDDDRAQPRPRHPSRRRPGDMPANCRCRPISKSRARSRSPPRTTSRAGSKMRCARSSVRTSKSRPTSSRCGGRSGRPRCRRRAPRRGARSARGARRRGSRSRRSA